MTSELERRWQNGSKPFNGRTVAFASDDLTPLPGLRLALLALVPRLQQHCPDAALFMLDDWHEHDGFISEAEPTSWQHLSDALVSDNALLALSTGESYVRRAFFPASYDFYLRVYIPADYDNGYPERRGDFDVTCVADLAAERAGLAASASGLPVAGSATRRAFLTAATADEGICHICAKM